MSQIGPRIALRKHRQIVNNKSGEHLVRLRTVLIVEAAHLAIVEVDLPRTDWGDSLKAAPLPALARTIRLANSSRSVCVFRIRSSKTIPRVRRRDQSGHLCH